MAVTLIATSKAADANSYITEAAATTYLSGSRLYITKWTDASSDEKKTALIWATSIWDYLMSWYGSIRTTTQALRLPRSGLVDLDGRNYDPELIPKPVEQATAELALSLLQKDRTKEPALLASGLSDVRLGPIQIKSAPREILPLVPDHLLAKLMHLGDVSGFRSGDRTVKVVRV